MPLIDMPLLQLLEYNGRNPCPNNFDDYWEEAIAEMHGVESDLELRPADFQVPEAECFHLFFTGVGGARIHAKYLRPRHRTNGKKAPAVCLFHGYSGHSGDWFDKLAYVACGFSVAALDCRGQGGCSQDLTPICGTTHHGHIVRGLNDPDPRKLLFRSIFLDAAQLARIVMSLPEVDPQRVGAAGGSQGGALTIACAALESGIKRAAPNYPFLCDYQRVWEMDRANDAYGELRTFFRHFNPHHDREEEIFLRLGYIDCQHLAKRIQAEVHMAIGLMDTICPPSSQFAAYNKIRSKKSYTLYPDFGHEHLPGQADKILTFMLGM
jgi:cephalosporin-C deacetylase